VKERLFTWDLASGMYILLGLFTPGRVWMFTGIFAGISIYMVSIAFVVAKPSLRLAGGDRFYIFKYPFSRILPLAYLASEPLSPYFEPEVANYTSPGLFGLPVWRITIVDPPAVQAYLISRGGNLSWLHEDWVAAVIDYRRALGILGFLEALGKLESESLDGVALAAAARLAIHSLPRPARIALAQALPSLTPKRRRAILEAFDILPAG